MRRWRRIVDSSLWNPIFFKGFLRAEKGWGSSLYRLPSPCHADTLIPAVRFFRKEKSSLLRAGDSLCRTRLPAQSTLEAFRVAVSAPPAGMNFFFTKKWAGGRSSLREVSARQVPHPQKDGNPRGRVPLAGGSEGGALRGLVLTKRSGTGAKKRIEEVLHYDGQSGMEQRFLQSFQSESGYTVCAP